MSSFLALFRFHHHHLGFSLPSSLVPGGKPQRGGGTQVGVCGYPRSHENSHQGSRGELVATVASVSSIQIFLTRCSLSCLTRVSVGGHTRRARIFESGNRGGFQLREEKRVIDSSLPLSTPSPRSLRTTWIKRLTLLKRVGTGTSGYLSWLPFFSVF